MDSKETINDLKESLSCRLDNLASFTEKYFKNINDPIIAKTYFQIQADCAVAQIEFYARLFQEVLENQRKLIYLFSDKNENEEGNEIKIDYIPITLETRKITGLSTRAVVTLKYNDVYTIEQLLDVPYSRIRRFRGVGQKTFDNIFKVKERYQAAINANLDKSKK
jgi:DNA-directed RNA polymerase alpha subunit